MDPGYLTWGFGCCHCVTPGIAEAFRPRLFVGGADRLAIAVCTVDGEFVIRRLRLVPVRCLEYLGGSGSVTMIDEREIGVFGVNHADYAAGTARSWVVADGLQPAPATVGYVIAVAIMRALKVPL